MSCYNCRCDECRRYRYNPYYRKNLDDYSPGNMRKPTLGKIQEYRNWWAGQGVHKASDLRNINLGSEELALDKIRLNEANYYWDRYTTHQTLYDTDHSLYKKPFLRHPDPDAEDYGDFEAVSPEAATRYLKQFFARQCKRLDAGLEGHDIEQYPFKPRYDEAVILLGQDVVDQLERDVYDQNGYLI